MRARFELRSSSSDERRLRDLLELSETSETDRKPRASDCTSSLGDALELDNDCSQSSMDCSLGCALSASFLTSAKEDGICNAKGYAKPELGKTVLGRRGVAGSGVENSDEDAEDVFVPVKEGCEVRVGWSEVVDDAKLLKGLEKTMLALDVVVSNACGLTDSFEVVQTRSQACLATMSGRGRCCCYCLLRCCYQQRGRAGRPTAASWHPS